MAKGAARKKLTAGIEQLLEALVATGDLELEKGASEEELADAWVASLESGQHRKLSDWLVEQDEVGELYADADDVESRVRSVLREASMPSRGQLENRKATSAYEPKLAEAIFDTPDDLDARAVYADWLQEQGDPRGELMLLQIARSRDGKAKPKEKAREKELLATHRRHFFGDLTMDREAAEHERVDVDLENGFFDAAQVPEEHALRQLLDLESARFLTSLEIKCRVVDPIDDLLARKQLPRGLRDLAIELPSHIQSYGRTTPLGELNLGRALRGLKYLERLEIHATRIRLDELVPSPLLSLVLDGERIDLGPNLFDSPDSLRSLVELNLCAGRLDGIEVLKHLFRRTLPRLSNIRFARFAEANFIKELLDSPLSSSLHKLTIPAHIGQFARKGIDIVHEPWPPAEPL